MANFGFWVLGSSVLKLTMAQLRVLGFGFRHLEADDGLIAGRGAPAASRGCKGVGWGCRRGGRGQLGRGRRRVALYVPVAPG